MSQQELTAQDATRFLQVPWCADILQQPTIVTFTPSSRAMIGAPLGGTPTRDQLFQRSLNNENTIPACVGFYENSHHQECIGNRGQHLELPDQQTGNQLQIRSSSLMFDLQPGVNGYNGTAHGGLIAALVDEAMGNFLLINSELQHREKTTGPLPRHILDLDTVGSFFTAEMKVQLRRPIITPQIVLVTANLSRIEGRKLFLQVTVRGEKEAAYALCEGLWISTGSGKL